MIRPSRAAPALAALLVTSSASAADRYALSMFHFNVQYVAGGLVGSKIHPDPANAPDDRDVEDAIVRVSLEPVLDLYAKHPTWGADVEMQGYMLDVLAERHPDVLAKLRAMATSGQIEVVSFHYSDQLFLAHAKEDWERSVALTQAAFAANGIPLGKAVFCQEGQSSEGMAAAMAAHGYETLVWPKNQFSFQHEGTTAEPLYRWGDAGFMVTSNGVQTSVGDRTLETTWTFVDDGELLATGGMNPYFYPDLYVVDPAALAKYEGELSDLEAGGFRITTVSDYVAAISSWVGPKTPPPLLDGTWQPGSTDGTYKWMGMGSPDDRDGDVHEAGALAHRELVLAEAAAKAAGLDAREKLDAAWRILALGEVSDATGVNPFKSEVEYGLAYQGEAARLAREVIDDAKAKLGGGPITIDAEAGSVTKGAAKPDEPVDADALFPLVVKSGKRPTSVTWKKAGEGHWIVAVTIEPGSGRNLSVTFPGTGDEIVYTPALSESPVHRKRQDFTFEHFDLTLQDGLVGLGGGRFLVKDQATVHVGARVRVDGPDVEIHEDTIASDETITWVFHVLETDEASATAFARGLNVWPRSVR